MDHQSFRFYIPGIVFLFPIYLVLCYLALPYADSTNIRSALLIGGIATFPAIALPVGWWIYNAYRVWWRMLTKGYENKDFVKLICKDTKPFYCPLTQSIHIDFSHITDIASWIKIDIHLFRKTFYPFTSFARFKKEISIKGIRPNFVEHLSDFILWKDSGYDYARSISSVRYGLESSVFALLLGCLYAFGLKQIFLFRYFHASSESVMIFWSLLLISLSLILVATLIKRWKDAGKEYDARLTLTTLTSIRSNYVDSNYFSKKIPAEIVTKIDQLELTEKPYAAFDLDNTLLKNDIGEAVFAALLKGNSVQNFDWKDYQDLIKKDRESAYKKVIEIMDGLELDKLKSVTHDIINSQAAYIEIGEDKIPIPDPNPIMQSLIFYLLTKGIGIYVVTASNKISAEIICWKYFGIPSSNVIGAEISTERNRIVSNPHSEIPYGIGKVNALKKRFTHKPIVTGGDGIWDKFLLDYTTSSGIRLWLGQNNTEFTDMRDAHYQGLNFFQISNS